MLQEAKQAVPALFAKPGDLFEWRTWTGDAVVEYVGRNEAPSKEITDEEFTNSFHDLPKKDKMTPKKGWLVFRNHGGLTPLNVTSGGIRDACGAWPIACTSQYNADGVIVEGTMCIPPENCGALKKCGCDDKEGEDNDDEPDEEIFVSKKLLQEAKRAAPVLFANPSSSFEWCSCDPSGGVESCIMKYVGRNQTPAPKSLNRDQIGWIVLKNLDRGNNQIDACSDGIRDEIGAWPISEYSQYNEEGKRISGTLCIPPEKCGAINVYKEPAYDSYW